MKLDEEQRLGRYDSEDPDTQRNIHSAADLLLRLMSHRPTARRAGEFDVDRLMNLMQFSLLWHLDLTCILDELRVRKSGWKRKLFARQIELIANEALDDSKALLDGELRELLTRVGVLGRLEPDLRRLHADLATLSRRYGRELGDLRNYTIAHRDHDADAQLQFIRQLDTKQMESLGWEIVRWTTKLYIFLDKAVNALGAELAAARGITWPPGSDGT